MNVTALSADSQAIVLLCSALASPPGSEVKPLSSNEWSSLGTTIHRSELQRPGALLGLDAEALEAKLDLGPTAAERLNRLLARGGQLALELDRLAGRGIWVITRADEGYPPLIKERLKGTAPPVFFGAGRPELLQERAIAIVGSRDADASSLAFATLLGRRCAEAGFAVVSGAARGVDSTAMVAAADAGGSAIGFVADALEKMTRRKDLREHLVEGSMTLATPYHPAARFNVGNAMRRNRLIYSLAEAAVVVAAAGENGGTRGGALENQKAGWTPMFVRADKDAPTGNHDLINHGGRPLLREDLDDTAALKQVLESAADEEPLQRTLDDAPPERSGREADEASPVVAHTPAKIDGGAQAPARATGESRGTTAVSPDDLYPVIWPQLAEFLVEPRSEREVAETFALELTQARAWLKRAVDDELVDRLGRQRRYRLAASRPAGLFALDDGQSGDQG